MGILVSCPQLPKAEQLIYVGPHVFVKKGTTVYRGTGEETCLVISHTFPMPSQLTLIPPYAFLLPQGYPGLSPKQKRQLLTKQMAGDGQHEQLSP